MLDKIKKYYKEIKERKIDTLLINLGILGVIIGIVLFYLIISIIFFFRCR